MTEYFEDDRLCFQILQERFGDRDCNLKRLYRLMESYFIIIKIRKVSSWNLTHILYMIKSRWIAFACVLHRFR